MSTNSVMYTKLNQTEGETTIFDYSSAFSYDSTEAKKNYASAFNYGLDRERQFDLQVNRGLEHKSIGVKIWHWSTVALYFLLIFVTFPISIWFVIKKVKSDEQVISSRLGIIKCIKGPAIIAVVPCVDKIKRYNTNLRAFNIPPQKALTSDGLLVEFGGILKYHITDAEKLCFAAQDIDHTMRVTAQTVAGKYIHTIREKELTDSAGINAVNADLKLELQRTFLPWGVAVNSYEMAGVKAVLRVEQQNAIADVIEPLKQWFFGGHEAGAPMSHTDNSPLAQMASMFAGSMSAMPASAGTATPEQILESTGQSQGNGQSPGAGQAPGLASVRHSLSPQDLLNAVKTISNRQLVSQVGTVYMFVVPDDDQRVYYMDLKHGDGDCGPGEPPGECDTTITVTLADMQLMFTGALQPFDAYMSGRLQVAGDISGAMKLDQLVKSIASISALTEVQC